MYSMPNYFSYLKNFLKKLFLKIKTNLEVTRNERISRYIFKREYIPITKSRPKYGAFLPAFNKDAKRYETSVFRIEGLNKSQIFDLGKYVENERNINSSQSQSLKGYARAIVRNITKNDLQIEKETSNHRLHANIIGWPKERETRKQLAILIAKSSISIKV